MPPTLLRRLKIIVSVLLVLLVLGAALYAGDVALQFKRSHPQYAGEVKLKGLSGPVHVYRDQYGVPHIFASDMLDAVRALGYIHADERMFQMEMQRRAGQGRLAEVLGSDMLGVDKFTRTLGLYRLAESSFEALSPEARAFFQAYADGVNDWLATHKDRLPPQFMLLGFRPAPWTPADSIVWGKLMGLQLSHNYKLEMLRGELAEKLTQQQVNALFPPPPPGSPITTMPHSRITAGKVDEAAPAASPPETAHPSAAPASAPSSAPAKKKFHRRSELAPPDAVDVALARLGQITGIGPGASNEWVIAGSRTESGKPILANDPHLGLEAPILWYLARIVTPGFSIKGATVPGLPIVLLGQNDHIAWGFTTTDSDVQDLFIETVDPKNPDNYLVPGGGSAPFTVRTETIKVKHGFNVTLKVRTTRHGPVLSDIDKDMAKLAGKGRVMAFAFTGLGAKDTTSEALMRLNRAQDWNEFLDALKLYQTPPQNIVYADTAGNIGYINPGLVPVRKASNGVAPVDGASGAFDWRGTVPFTQLPQLYNPAAGLIFNANNAIVGPGQLYFYGVDWEEPYRAERLQHFFDTIEKHSLDTTAAMQADHVSMAARELLPYLLAVKPQDRRAQEALDMLKGWDGTMDKDRPEPLIFDAWLYEMHKEILVDMADNPLKERGPYMANAISGILGGHDTEWCGDELSRPAPNCNAAIGRALDNALDMLGSRESGDMKQWRWGNESVAWLKNKFYSHIPFLSGRSDLSLPSSGDFYTLDRGGSFAPEKDHPFARTQGGGFRGIYDLSDPDKSRFMIATGESGHILSPYYGNLAPLWNDVKSFTLSGSEKDLMAEKLPELVMVPGQ